MGQTGFICSAPMPEGMLTRTATLICALIKEPSAAWQLGGLAADLEDALGIPVDLIPTGSLDSKFLNSISDDEVLLYEAS